MLRIFLNMMMNYLTSFRFWFAFIGQAIFEVILDRVSILGGLTSVENFILLILRVWKINIALSPNVDTNLLQLDHALFVVQTNADIFNKIFVLLFLLIILFYLFF